MINMEHILKHVIREKIIAILNLTTNELAVKSEPYNVLVSGSRKKTNILACQGKWIRFRVFHLYGLITLKAMLPEEAAIMN